MLNSEIVPTELKALRQWVLWRKEHRNGKTTKVPYQLIGKRASTSDPATWNDFNTLLGELRKTPSRFDGLGFVFTSGDAFVGIDLDGCLLVRNRVVLGVKSWAKPILGMFSESYMERSPSGLGVKIWVKGDLPGSGKRCPYEDGAIEMYEYGRFFTVTGEAIDASANPKTPPISIKKYQSHTADLYRLISSVRPMRPVHPSGPRVSSRLSVADWIANHGLEVTRGPVPFQGGVKWILKQCPFNPEHRGTSVAVFQSATGAPGFRCLHSSCADKDWHALRDLYEPNRHQKRSTKAKSEPQSANEGGGSSGQGSSFPPSAMEPDLRYGPHTDTGNAERLVALFGREIHYCVEMKRWVVWDGRRWSMEDPRRVKVFAKRTIRRLYDQAAEIEDLELKNKTERHARRSEMASAISAMLTCAEYEGGIPIYANQLDTHPYLLNFWNGTLDLKSGKLREHRQEDLVTKLVRFDYRPEAECPKFMRFLYHIMGDTPEESDRGRERADRMVGYLQKCLGYCLSGDVSEKAVFCFFGRGNNGKTTLLETIRFLLAEYSSQVMIDTLMAHRNRENNTSLADLADLRGARFVTTSEAEEGQRLAVGKVKYLTQGSSIIKACRKYENPFEFMPTQKLFLDANHRPVIPANESAIWNRLKPIPFEIEIQPNDIDKTLLEKLKLEAEGILAWMVRGWRRLEEEGLGDPPEILEASLVWQADSDSFNRFLKERCIIDGANTRIWVPVADLWPAYRKWIELNNEKDELPKPEFDRRLELLGCKRGVRNDGKVRAWIGVRFRCPEDEQTDPPLRQP
jgi:putative DNA primase/helicase